MKYLVTLLLTVIVFVGLVSSIRAATSHVVISEVQIAGTTATDEFVELFNPTGADVSLVGWRLTKKTSSGTESTLISSMSGTIAAGGHYLVAHENYDGTPDKNAQYSTSASIAADNTVVLYSDSGATIVDKVGMGSATDREGSAAVVPASNQSVTRIGDDTDNNASDFALNLTPDPQNAATVSPTPTATATPTNSPTLQPSPTASPTLSPTPTASASPTTSPSLTPTPSPTATVSPSPTSSPIVSPTPRFIVAQFGLPGHERVCYLTYRFRMIGWSILFLPQITCE